MNLKSKKKFSEFRIPSKFRRPCSHPESRGPIKKWKIKTLVNISLIKLKN